MPSTVKRSRYCLSSWQGLLAKTVPLRLPKYRSKISSQTSEASFSSQTTLHNSPRKILLEIREALEKYEIEFLTCLLFLRLDMVFVHTCNVPRYLRGCILLRHMTNRRNEDSSIFLLHTSVSCQLTLNDQCAPLSTRCLVSLSLPSCKDGQERQILRSLLHQRLSNKGITAANVKPQFITIFIASRQLPNNHLRQQNIRSSIPDHRLLPRPKIYRTFSTTHKILHHTIHQQKCHRMQQNDIRSS